MDWIDEQAERLKNWLTNMNLKRSLGIYLFAAVLSVLAAVFITGQICDGWIGLLESPYRVKQENLVITKNGLAKAYYYGHIFTDWECIPGRTRVFLTFLYGIRHLSVILYTLAAVIIVAKLYYKNKLKEPFALLLKEAEYIGNNKLDFSCRYESGDEVGTVCNAVDMMRIQLGENKGRIWEEMEEQRRLNAAFAHDMRTPLTVLHGYVDLLTDYYSQGDITPEKMQEILEMMDGQLYRLEEFANTMKKIHGLNERKVEKREIFLSEIRERMEETVMILNHSQKIRMELRAENLQDTNVKADLPLILEVTDNLISNALRYAKDEICIQIEYDNSEQVFRLYVKDDGRGFTGEELKMAVRPYYGEEKGTGIHFGIGLSICKILCEQHGGSLSLSNSVHQGAIVCAEFGV